MVLVLHWAVSQCRGFGPIFIGYRLEKKTYAKVCFVSLKKLSWI